MTTILSLNDWFEVTSRGTSGDQVSDILYSWKEQSEKKDAENERLKEALKWISDKTLEWENINAIGNPDNQVIQWWHLGDKARYTLKALKEMTNSETDYREHLRNMPESEYRRLHENRWENDESEGE